MFQTKVLKKREWAECVADQLDGQGLLSEDGTLVSHASKDHYGELLPLIEDSEVNIKIPTEGLATGEKQA